jgi:hypothetical protein
MKRIMQFMVALMVLGSPSIASAANIVVNGSFETGNFAGWRQVGDLSTTGVTNSPTFEYKPTDGNFHALFGPSKGYGGIVQDIGEIGQKYTVSFDLANRSGIVMFVVFGGNYLLINAPKGPYAHYSYDVTYNSSSGLQFHFYNPADYYYLDNVSVTPFTIAAPGVPEPASWVMMMMGFGVMGFVLRRRNGGARIRFA